MATITQTESIQAVFIWMGSTEEEECLPFDLTPYKSDGAHQGIIDKVVQLNSAPSTGGGGWGWIGLWVPGQPVFMDSLNGGTDKGKLVCGSCYMAQVLPAADAQSPGSITIPGAVLAYGNEPGKGNVFNKGSSKPQFLGDISNLPSCICKGEFRNLITDAQSGTNYPSATTLTPDQDGIYIKSDGSIHRIFSGKSINIPAGSKLLKGKFGTLDTDGDGVPDMHDSEPDVSDRDSGSSGGSPTQPSQSIDNFLLAKNAGAGVVHAGCESHVSFISLENTSRWNTYNIGVEPGMKDLYYTGLGTYSQLGNNSTANTKNFTLHQTFKMSEAFKVPVVQVSAGKNHTLVLKADGSVHTHGYNDYGQLGVGIKTSWVNQSWSTIINSGAVQVSAGDEISMVLMEDGTVLGFGNNNSSGISPSSAGQDMPTPSTLATDAVYVSAGDRRSIIVKSDGTVWGSGTNSYATIGPYVGGGSIINGYTQFASDVIKAEVSGNRTVLQKSNGSIWTRGSNNMGQLGDGTTTNRYSEVEIIASGVEKWTAGGGHTLVIKEDGSLWGWGLNSSKQLTDVVSGNFTTSPVKILDNNVTAVAGGNSHTIIQQYEPEATAYKFYTWGLGSMGQLGNNKDGSSLANEDTPFWIQTWLT